MKWRKKGLIFDPSQHELPNGCRLFAQSPQALVFNNFVRIYFSSRELESSGKYKSHVLYVDMSRDFKSILAISNSSVISLGGTGCFDEHGIFPMNVLRVGTRVYGYTCGWSRRQSVSVETAIGLAMSSDNGITFEKLGNGPILSASLNEACLVGDPFVLAVDGIFHMWYIFGTGWKRKHEGSDMPERTYKIGHAVSMDGMAWEKNEGRQIIEDLIGSDECQALPTVVKISGVYHMFFCYRETFDFRKRSGRGYRIGHASSRDLVKWKRDESVLALNGTPDAWDSHMQCYPHAFECGGKIYLLYNGNEFGRYGFGLAELED